MSFRKTIIALTTATLFGTAAIAGDHPQDGMEADDNPSVTSEFTGAAKDAWIDGKLEATYMINRGLSAFDIETRVNNGAVLLTGAVENDAQRELAEQIAIATDGVESVDNQLLVEDGSARDEQMKFARQIEDATIAATLKTKLLLNSDVAGTAIDVDVENGEATLSGSVADNTIAELAEYIARNTNGVTKVHNDLQISS